MDNVIIENCKHFNAALPKKYWDTTHITGDQHTNARSKPAPYLKKTMEIARMLGLNNVVEIGATRYGITPECVNYFNGDVIDPFVSPACCADGHGGVMFALNGFNVHSVDIDTNCLTAAKWSFESLKREIPPNLHLCIPRDGIEFLTEFDGSIDVLFLDGWDVGTHKYRESHLKAFEAAQGKLSNRHLILVDDCDFTPPVEGKDALLTPALLSNGYAMLFEGRQKLFINIL